MRFLAGAGCRRLLSILSSSSVTRLFMFARSAYSARRTPTKEHRGPKLALGAALKTESDVNVKRAIEEALAHFGQRAPAAEIR
jgi:hypothetical protein